MSQNDELFERAQRSIPGGVNSPVRAFRAVGGTPRFFVARRRAVLLGRRRQALHRLRRLLGTARSSGTRIPRSSRRCARRRRTDSPSARRPSSRSSWPSCSARRCRRIELVRLVSSGTEATMTALRLARGFTGRPRIVKFEGCYHGHADSPARQGGLGRADARQPQLRRRHAGDRGPHDRARLQRRRSSSKTPFASSGDEIAAVIVEPVAGNMNLVSRRARVPAGDARAVHEARRGAHLRRGDDRLPRGRRRARRGSTASRPTSRRSAR